MFQISYSAWEMMEMFGKVLRYCSLSETVWKEGNLAQGKNSWSLSSNKILHKVISTGVDREVM